MCLIGSLGFEKINRKELQEIFLGACNLRYSKGIRGKKKVAILCFGVCGHRNLLDSGENVIVIQVPMKFLTNGCFFGEKPH